MTSLTGKSLLTSSRFKPVLFFLAYLFITLLIYWPTRQAGFVMDFIGWQARFEQGIFTDVLNSFGYPGLHQVFHSIFYSLYCIVGLNGGVWMLLFGILHAVNAVLLQQFALKVLRAFDIRHASQISIATTLIFLLSPYHVEVLVWKVCMHYLLSFLFLFSGMHFLWDYLESGKQKALVFLLLTYCAALFTLEFALVFPLIFISVFILWKTQAKTGVDVKMQLLPLAVPFMLLGGYLVLNRIALGSYVGHYGADVHLQLNPFDINATIWQYFLKILCFFRFTSFDIKTTVFGSMLHPLVQFGLLFISVSLAVIMPMIWKRISAKWRIISFAGFGFAVTILPISNLFFYYLQYGENDRYGYLATAFFAIGFATVCFMLPKLLRYVIIAGFLFTSTWFSLFMRDLWVQSQEIYSALIKDFDSYESENVYVLGVPDNYRGIFMFRIINGPTGFKETLQYHRGRPFEGEMFDVLQFNMATPHDGLRVEQLSERQFRVGFNQWGNWWWRNGIGAGSYENEHYILTMEGLTYLVEFKKDIADSALLYMDGLEWKRVTGNR